MAWCNTGSWKNDTSIAAKRCKLLLLETLSDAQKEKAVRKLRYANEKAVLLLSESAKTNNDTIDSNQPNVNGNLDCLPMKVSLGYDSYYEIFQNVIKCDEFQFDHLREFMEFTVKASPNPRNPKFYLKRKQCTFVTEHASEYEFGKYNETFRFPLHNWPQLVQDALRLAQNDLPFKILCVGCINLLSPNPIA